MKAPEFSEFCQKVRQVLGESGVYPHFSDLDDTFIAEFTTRGIKGAEDPMAGMIVAWQGHPSDQFYEVYEIMAGPKQDRLWVYMETKRLACAVKNALKGNNRSKKLKIW